MSDMKRDKGGLVIDFLFFVVLGLILLAIFA